MQNWIKYGCIFENQNNRAQMPTVFQKSDKIWRIFFSELDPKHRSQTKWIDVEAGNPQNIIDISQKPILELGKPGTFDNSGIMPTWVLKEGFEIRLYYIGWVVRKDIPYHNSLGLAISYDNGNTFFKKPIGPLLASTPQEPYFNGACGILKDNHLWHMWYLSCTDWLEKDGKLEPRYHTKYATSRNGINWKQTGNIALDYKNDQEGGIVRASIIKKVDRLCMWYSYRNRFDYRDNIENSYKIGYAEQRFPNKEWIRKDNEVNLALSEDGWDSKMLCYPHVIEYNNKYYMFYNGNEFGNTGIGYATLKL